MDHIRVSLVRSGGFGGLSREGSLDTSALDAEAAREVADLVDRLDLPRLAETRRAPGRPDGFQYDLTVERGDQQWQLSLAESQVAPELRPLLQRVLRAG
ncbi:MAG: hypothetical protein M3P96_16160 [Actinomycetota bacterium]|nr:hypothetical protein [Actinomycetota bacterium]